MTVPVLLSPNRPSIPGPLRARSGFVVSTASTKKTGNRFEAARMSTPNPATPVRQRRYGPPGYESPKGPNILQFADRLKRLSVESPHTIEILQLRAAHGNRTTVPRQSLIRGPDPIKSGRSFAVHPRTRSRDREWWGLGRVFLTRRARVRYAGRPSKRLLAKTALRYAYEVRRKGRTPYLRGNTGAQRPSGNWERLAAHIIQTKSRTHAIRRNSEGSITKNARGVWWRFLKKKHPGGPIEPFGTKAPNAATGEHLMERLVRRPASAPETQKKPAVAQRQGFGPARTATKSKTGPASARETLNPNRARSRCTVALHGTAFAPRIQARPTPLQLCAKSTVRSKPRRSP